MKTFRGFILSMLLLVLGITALGEASGSVNTIGQNSFLSLPTLGETN